MTIYKQTVFAIMYAFKQIALLTAPKLPSVVQPYLKSAGLVLGVSPQALKSSNFFNKIYRTYFKFS
jgi:hypothetical protein